MTAAITQKIMSCPMPSNVSPNRLERIQPSKMARTGRRMPPTTVRKIPAASAANAAADWAVPALLGSPAVRRETMVNSGVTESATPEKKLPKKKMSCKPSKPGRCRM